MKLIHSQIMDKTTANDMTHAEVNEMVVALERELEDTVPASYLNLDPTRSISPHSSDDELASDGYNTGGSEDEIEQLGTDRVPEVGEYCSCGKCMSMATRVESFCCQESEMVGNIIEGHECVVENPRFSSEILDKRRLEFNRYLYAQTIPDSAGKKKYLGKELDNGMLRHLAYKTFVSLVMCGQPLGKWRRAALPPCVVRCISL